MSEEQQPQTFEVTDGTRDGRKSGMRPEHYL
jgi:hypothetical protein